MKRSPTAAGKLARAGLRTLGAVGEARFNTLLGLMLLWLLLPAAAWGGSGATAPHQGLRLSQAGRGSLLFPSAREGWFLPAPALETDVRMEISGPIARVQVRQRFRNPSRAWREGVYVFPLPDDAAVDGLRLRLGARIIEGREAGLVLPECPDLFITSLANIPPGGEIAVEIAYRQTVRYDGERYRLRFPMVAGPRHVPGEVGVAGAGGAGRGVKGAAAPDAERITPPVRLPAEGPGNPVSIEIVLDAGFPLARVRSIYLGLDHRAPMRRRVRIAVEGNALPADRDFDLEWTPAAGGSQRPRRKTRLYE